MRASLALEDAPVPTEQEATGSVGLYLSSSRRIGPSLALVLPLLLAHEVAVALLNPPVRNSADQVITELMSRLPSHTLPVFRWAGVLALLVLLVRRRPERHDRPALVLGEALLWAVCLGPLVGSMVGGLGLSAGTGWVTGQVPLWQAMLLSVGAGLWEEIVFRLGLLGGLALFLRRVARCSPVLSVGVAIVASAAAFSLYHHLGDGGEPFTMGPFVFRALAGTILGLLFALRGFAVVVYMHVFYDLLCDMRAAFA
ncbi:MAG: hypothetical protein ACI9EF_002841 [Pseudohongiellaceae bacterium]|jgi:hypothetical protein